MINIPFIVYKVTNNFNNKVYIGQTSVCIEDRWRRHTSNYQLNDGTYFHNALKKHGYENFVIEEIRRCENQEELDIIELEEILKIPLDQSYNTKRSSGKSGGDTLSNHPNINEISQKISASKMGGKNPNSRKIIAINIITGEKIEYDSFADCQRSLDIPRHDIIGRRCSGKIKKPYNNEWLFEYIY